VGDRAEYRLGIVGAVVHTRGMALVGVAPGWAVPGPTQIDDLGVLAERVHDEAASKAAAGSVPCWYLWVMS
jgi:hypothetical protein